MIEIIEKSDVDVKLQQDVGGDHVLAAAAWVVDDIAEALEKERIKPGEIERIINYLMKHRHGSPFEHGLMTFCVDAPILVWREHHRHRIGWSYNEESARYKTLRPTFYIPRRDRPMMKVEDWRPGRPKFTICEDDEIFDKLRDNLLDDYTRSYNHYVENLELGIDPGLARDGLNVGIYSSCWTTCNPRSMMAFLSLRTYRPEMAKFVSYPLWEIELVAENYERVFSELYPLTYDAFNNNGRVAP